jgi:hypothetical protein
LDRSPRRSPRASRKGPKMIVPASSRRQHRHAVTSPRDRNVGPAGLVVENASKLLGETPSVACLCGH